MPFSSVGLTKICRHGNEFIMHDFCCCCRFAFGAIKYSSPNSGLHVYISPWSCVFGAAKRQTTNSFCGCQSCLFFFFMPIVCHQKTHTGTLAHVPTNTLKAFNVFFIEGATAILIPIAIFHFFLPLSLHLSPSVAGLHTQRMFDCFCSRI